VVFTTEEAGQLPAAIDLMVRREQVILIAARKPGFDVAAMREAMLRQKRSRSRPASGEVRRIVSTDRWRSLYESHTA
jgi:hypothetical protein